MLRIRPLIVATSLVGPTLAFVVVGRTELGIAVAILAPLVYLLLLFVTDRPTRIKLNMTGSVRFYTGLAITGIVGWLFYLAYDKFELEPERRRVAFEHRMQLFGEDTMRRYATTAKAIVVNGGHEIRRDSGSSSMPPALGGKPSGRVLFIWTHYPGKEWDGERWGAHLRETDEHYGLSLAERPEEVETVVLVERDREVAGAYVDSEGRPTDIKSFVCYFYSYVVVLKTATVLGQVKLPGGVYVPQKKTDRRNIECGEPDRRLLYDWLRGVPILR